MQLKMDGDEEIRRCRLSYAASMPRLRTAALPAASAGIDFWRKITQAGGRFLEEVDRSVSGASMEEAELLKVSAENAEVLQPSCVGKSGLDTDGTQFREELKFLPTEVNGVVILIEESEHKWRATNAQLNADTDGIDFRSSKHIEDRCASGSDLLRWGDLVSGFCESDGWVRVAMQETASRPQRQSKVHKGRVSWAGNGSKRRCSAPPSRRSRSVNRLRIGQRWSLPSRSQRPSSYERAETEEGATERPSDMQQAPLDDVLDPSLASAMPARGVQPGRKVLPRPPCSECWDWPLTRQEKKARILLIDKQIIMDDRKHLQEELEVLRSLDTGTPWCS